MNRPGARGQPGSVIAVVLAGVVVLSVPSLVVPALAPVTGDPSPIQAGGPGNGSSLAGPTAPRPAVPTPHPTPTDVLPAAQSRTANGAHASNLTDRSPELQVLRASLNSDSRLNRTAALAASETVLAARQRTATSERLKAKLAIQRTTLRGSRALLEGPDPNDERGSYNLSAVTRLVELGLKMQTAQVSTGTTPIAPTEVTLPPPPTPQHDSPSAAVFAILDRSKATPTAAQTANVRTLDDLPEPTRTELTDVLEAYIGYVNAVNGTTMDVGWTQLRSQPYGSTLPEPVRYRRQAIPTYPTGQFPDEALAARRIRAAQLQFLQATADFEAALAHDGTTGLSSPSQHGIAPQNVSVQTENMSIDLSTHDNTYSRKYNLQIDVGGNDTYNNNAGGVYVPSDWSRRAAALVDILGDDRYNGRNGGANSHDTQGERPGAGFLLDVGGEDRYAPETAYGGNGGGAMSGFGFLVDAGVEGDTYAGHSYGTNGGGHRIGQGFLLDTGGSDTYYAGGRGVNGGAWRFGVGFLMDGGLGDDDVHSGGGGTNGGGSEFGVGFMLDTGRGKNTYEAGGRGTNGGGDLLSSGFLLDNGGEDTYVAGSSGTNGGGFDGGSAFLLDTGIGDDSYDAGGKGTNGGAVSNTISFRGQTVPLHSEGLLVDTGGNDAYTGGDTGINGGAVQATTADGPVPARSLLFDLIGSDIYIENGVTCRDRNCFDPLKGTIGAQVDLVGASVPPTTSTPTPTPTPTSTPTPTPTNQPPSVQVTSGTQVNNVGSPLKVTANASDGDGTVVNVSLVWANGSTVDAVHCGMSQCTVDLSTVPANSTWNESRDAYNTISLGVVARDDDAKQASESISVQVHIAGDATGDGVVDIFDGVAIGNAWETARGDDGFSDGADLTNDGQVDIFDGVQVGNNWEDTAGAS